MTIEAYFEPFEQIYPERYEQEYGSWRPVVGEVILKYLDCWDLHQGFARLRCRQCGEESLLEFSCKVRYFCPSCHQRRVAGFAQRVDDEVLDPVPQRQYAFTLPKRLRVYFKYDRRLPGSGPGQALGDLGRSGYESLKELFRAILPDSEATPGAVVAIQTFGELLNIHPHLHGLATDGGFDREGTFYRLPSWVDMPRLTELFRHKVLPSLRSIEDWKLESANLRFPISNLQFSIRPRRERMLLSKGKITKALVENLLSWPHSGFHVHQSPPRT